MAVAVERISSWGPSAVRLLRASLSAVLLSAALAASAHAGQYQVYSCRTPWGQAAPTEGWSPSSAGTAAITLNTCSQAGGALVAGLGDQIAHTSVDQATWAFVSLPFEHLVGADLWRASVLHGRNSEEASWYQSWLSEPLAPHDFDQCDYKLGCVGRGEPGDPMWAANRVEIPSVDLGSQISVNVGCATGQGNAECGAGFGDPSGYAAVIYLYAADLTLEQSAPPSVSSVGGELATAPVVSGTSDVAFSASDPGSGVYEAVFSVDGLVVQRTVLNGDGGRCRSVGQGGAASPPAFLYVQPCPAQVNADVAFDTAKLSDGAHHLVVSVTDAAGNAATVVDRNITVDNSVPAGPPVPSGEGAPNGTNASPQASMTVAWKAARGERLSSAYGHAQTIVGHLAGAGGVPIGGAQVAVLATPRYTGAVTAAVADVRTAADGSFSLQLPASVSSRTLRFQYSDRIGAAPVATDTLVLSVRAALSLTIRPRTASAGHSIRFSGELAGGPIPSGGKLLVLEARSPGGAWLEFDVIRSDARGRYHASYRFKFPGPAYYQFRVLCQAEADYPFATGASRVVGVLER